MGVPVFGSMILWLPNDAIFLNKNKSLMYEKSENKRSKSQFGWENGKYIFF